jgi:hypothetical protein
MGECAMEGNKAEQVNPMFIIYAILAVVFGLAYAIWPPGSFGFFSRIFIFIFATIFSFVGILIGDAVRKIAIPDSIFTTGGIFAILKQKLFWFIGPQLVGALIGGSIGSAIIRWIIN